MNSHRIDATAQSPIGQRPRGIPQVRFLTVLMGGLAIVTLAALYAPVTLQIAALGALLSLQAALLVASFDLCGERLRRSDTLLAQVRVPVALAADHDLFHEYEKFTNGLLDIAGQRNSMFRELAKFRISSVCDEITELAAGKTEFRSTETWRSVYQQILEGLEVKAYYSVAWVRSVEYWSDSPGRQGMQLNFDLAERGYRIERVVILPDSLWPYDAELPVPEIRHWLDQQYQHGLVLALVREHELANETDILGDFGVYGDQAVGFQVLDEQSRTVLYRLDFSPLARKKAHDRWERLNLYAKPYQGLVDRPLPV